MLKIRKKSFKKLIICANIAVILSNTFNCSYASLNSTNTEERYKMSIQNLGSSSNEAFNGISPTKDGGFIAVGYTVSAKGGFSNNGEDDALIAKYSSDGSCEWYRTFGGSGIDSFKSVTELNDGSIIAVGHSSSKNAGFTNTGHYDAIIVKYSNSGSRRWIKSIGGINYEGFDSVISTKDGGFIVSGGGNSGILFIKYDADGNQEWRRYFGNGTDYFESIKETQDGGIIAVGTFTEDTSSLINKGQSDGIIVKYDADGNEEWCRSIGGSGTDKLYSVIETKNGDFISVGSASSTDADFENAGGYTSIIVKHDAKGNQQWIKTFDGTSHDEFNSIIQGNNEELIVIGYSSSTDGDFTGLGMRGYDGIIVKYDTNGNVLDTINFGGSKDDYFNSAVKTHDRKILIVGKSNSIDAGFVNKGGYDCTIVELKEITSIDIATEAVEMVEGTLNADDAYNARDLVNQLPESTEKESLQDRLNAIFPDMTLDIKNASANLDLYIKSENMLSMSLDTNSITFDDFSGIEDSEKVNAVNIIINSSLPYQLNAYLPVEIQNSDKSTSMDKDILNIKENSESAYQTFENTTDEIVLKDNCLAGNDLIHGIDIKLKGGLAFEKDIYKTTIKFEAQQK